MSKKNPENQTKPKTLQGLDIDTTKRQYCKRFIDI